MSEEENNKPLLENILTSDDPNIINQIIKKDEEMRDSFENYSKILNKMKKNVDNMGDNKLMNYQNLFNEFDKDMISFNEEQKKLLEIKEILNSEVNLPENVKNNLSKVNKDLENKKKIFENLKNKVEEYKEKYTKDENKKYDNLFNNEKYNKEVEKGGPDQKLMIKNNEQIIQERKNIIEQAKKTSSQIVDTSKIIKNVINQQGENLNDIENNIIEAVDNFKKGGEELKKYKKSTEKKITKNKMFYVIICIILLVIFIIFLLRKLL